MQSSKNRIDNSKLALGSNDEIGPALVASHASLFVGDSLQRAYDRCSNRDNTRAARACFIDGAGGDFRNAVPLGIWRLVTFEARDACVQSHRNYVHTLSSQTLDNLMGESAAC